MRSFINRHRVRLPMKKILIVAPYCSLPSEPYFNRFLYLAQCLSSTYDVTLITSDFRHFDKKHRDTPDRDDCPEFKICLIGEPGYKDNVSLQRVISHKVFVKNFKNWLKGSFDFDLVYSAYPLIETNIVLADLKKREEFKLVIDVQDIWPESITSAIPLLYYLPIKLLPFTRKANKAYASADGLVSVSSTYMDRARLVNKSALSEVVYIGSDFSLIDSAPIKIKDNTKFTLVYLGTLSYSYDVETIIKAVNKLVFDGFPIEFHIFGGGPFEEDLKKVAGQGVIFHGFNDISIVFSFLKTSDVAVNCLSSTAKQSVTNKLSDFMSIGIPILNSQTNEEVLTLLEGEDHVNYRAGNVQSAIDKILFLYKRKGELKFKPDVRFNRELEYKKIIALVDSLVECP